MPGVFLLSLIFKVVGGGERFLPDDNRIVFVKLSCELGSLRSFCLVVFECVR